MYNLSVQHVPVLYSLYNIFLHKLSLYNMSCITFSCTTFHLHPVQYFLHKLFIVQHSLYNMFLYNLLCTLSPVQYFPVQHRMYIMFLYNVHPVHFDVQHLLYNNSFMCSISSVQQFLHDASLSNIFSTISSFTKNQVQHRNCIVSGRLCRYAIIFIYVVRYYSLWYSNCS